MEADFDMIPVPCPYCGIMFLAQCRLRIGFTEKVTCGHCGEHRIWIRHGDIVVSQSPKPPLKIDPLDTYWKSY